MKIQNKKEISSMLLIRNIRNWNTENTFVGIVCSFTGADNKDNQGFLPISDL